MVATFPTATSGYTTLNFTKLKAFNDDQIV